MALVQPSQARQIFIDDTTGQKRLVLVATDGSTTDVVGITGLLDPVTEVQQGINYDHGQIHAGRTFTLGVSQECTNTNEMTVFAFNTPAGAKRVHMVAVATATSGSSFFILEGPSIDPDEGTSQSAPLNRDRSSSTISIVTSIKTSPVANEVTFFDLTDAASANITISVGTTLWHEDIGVTGNPQSASGGASRGQSEWPLAPSTQYAFLIRSEDNNNNTHNLILNWYEHTSLA